MILTSKQEEGLRIAVDRYQAGEKYTVISGYAGSGKSTLIKFIIDALEVNKDVDVCYVAFTGKAATVLQQKGCPNATTAHKLLYYAKPMPNGNFKFEKKKRLECKIVVVDEISMLPKSMWNLLLTHKVYILAAGDPGQLPPIDKDEDNHVLDHPHIFLDEIMRQAQNSEIIRLSMWVREGKSIDSFPFVKEEVDIYPREALVSGMYNWADQIICATNQTRDNINNYVREIKGYGKEPEIGDKVISLCNHWEYYSASGNWVLTNGSIGTIKEYSKRKIYIPSFIYKGPIDYMFSELELEDGDLFVNTPIDYKCLLNGGTPTLNKKQLYLFNKYEEQINEWPPFDFVYAYAITCHKAQGSEWDKVLVFEEDFPKIPLEHKQWLYTAITRASKKVVVIKK